MGETQHSIEEIAALEQERISDPEKAEEVGRAVKPNYDNVVKNKRLAEDFRSVSKTLAEGSEAQYKAEGEAKFHDEEAHQGLRFSLDRTKFEEQKIYLERIQDRNELEQYIQKTNAQREEVKTFIKGLKNVVDAENLAWGNHTKSSDLLDENKHTEHWLGQLLELASERLKKLSKPKK